MLALHGLPVECTLAPDPRGLELVKDVLVNGRGEIPSRCVRQFGTPDKRSGVGLFKAKKALAPASCPVP